MKFGRGGGVRTGVGAGGVDASLALAEEPKTEELTVPITGCMLGKAAVPEPERLAPERLEPETDAAGMPG